MNLTRTIPKDDILTTLETISFNSKVVYKADTFAWLAPYSEAISTNISNEWNIRPSISRMSERSSISPTENEIEDRFIER
jgi:hypothetical protein